MTKAMALKIVNVLILLALLIQLGTGVGLLARPGEELGDFHAVNGFVFGGLALIHLGLNWNWVKATFFKRKTPA